MKAATTRRHRCCSSHPRGASGLKITSIAPAPTRPLRSDSPARVASRRMGTSHPSSSAVSGGARPAGPGSYSRRPAGFEVIPLGLTLQAASAHPVRLPVGGPDSCHGEAHGRMILDGRSGSWSWVTTHRPGAPADSSPRAAPATADSTQPVGQRLLSWLVPFPPRPARCLFSCRYM